MAIFAGWLAEDASTIMDAGLHTAAQISSTAAAPSVPANNNWAERNLMAPPERATSLLRLGDGTRGFIAIERDLNVLLELLVMRLVGKVERLVCYIDGLGEMAGL